MSMVSLVRPELVAPGAAVLASLLLAGAFALESTSGQVRSASIAAVAVELLLVAIGAYLYAWRLGAPGRSD